MNDEPPTPPSFAQRMGELRTVREPVRLALRTPRFLLDSPKGPRRTVILLPGLGAGDASSLPLRGYLHRLGHRPVGWGLGRNGRDPAVTTARFLDRLESVALDAGEPVVLVGWSLGGIVARAATLARPDLVRRIITYGTPLHGPRYTAAAGLYADHELDQIETAIADARDAPPIAVPITALYSKRDGIVDWRTCIDTDSPNAENVEVSSTHLGLGLDPDVWTIIGERLAEPDSHDE